MLTKSPLLSITLISVLIATAAVVFAKIPYQYRLFAIAATYILVGIFILASQDRLKLIGLQPSELLSGLKLALPFMLFIFSAALVVFTLQPELFQDSRYNTTLTRLLFSLFILLPFATVIIEELLFRGLLFGVANTFMSTVQAVLLSSFFFGIWHVFSAQAFTISALRLPNFLLVTGIVIATAVAGAFFTWLRIRSGSLIAPILVHWSINATGMLLAYLSFK